MTQANAIIGQSGGPTAVINSSLIGIVDAAMESPQIGKVFGMRFGIEGVLQNHLIDLSDQPLLPHSAVSLPGRKTKTVISITARSCCRLINDLEIN